MIQIYWELTEVQSLLQNVLRVAKWPQNVLQDVGNTLLDKIDETFQDEAGPWGRPWKDIKESTERLRVCNSGGILEDCGELRNSFYVGTLAGVVMVTTDLAKAGTMQWGAKKGEYGEMSNGQPIPWGRIPARPMLPLRGNPGELDLPDDWVEAVAHTLEAHLQEAIDRTTVGGFFRNVGRGISDFFRGLF